MSVHNQETSLSEIQLAVHLQAALSEAYGFDFVRRNTNLRARRFGQWWKQWFAGKAPIPQPDIDLLVVNSGKITAIELKYVRRRGQGQREKTSPSYYGGIGQALALLRFGFDHVQLWHCFSEAIPDAKIAARLESTRALVTALGLPIGFAALKVVGAQGAPGFREVYLSFGEPPLIEYEKPPHPERYERDNPLRGDPDSTRARKFITRTLNLPID